MKGLSDESLDEIAGQVQNVILIPEGLTILRIIFIGIDDDWIYTSDRGIHIYIYIIVKR